MGVKPLKRNIYCILQDEEPLQSGHEIKSYLALSQQHEFPLSLQLAHCKLCRQGVPNKQATRANITCSTLFSSFIFSPQLDLKLYLWEHLIVMMHSLSFQSPLDTLSASSGPDNWDIPHTAAGSSTSNRVSKQSQCAHKQTETLRGAGTDLNRKNPKGRKSSSVRASCRRPPIWPQKISFGGSNLKNRIDTDKWNHMGRDPRWSLNGSCGDWSV